MQHRMRTALLTAATLLASAGLALAQPHDPPPPPLGGPPIHDRAVPGAGDTFIDPVPGEKAKATPRVAPRVFFDAVRALGAEDTPPELHPTPEQREAFRAIVDDFRAEARGMMEQRRGEQPPPPGERRRRHRDRADGGPPPPPGEGPPPPPDGERRRPRQRRPDVQANELPPPPPPPPGEAPPPPERRRQGPPPDHADAPRGPRPDGYYARIWQLLDDHQRAFVKHRIDEARRERLMEREEPIVREGVRRELAEDRDPAGPRFRDRGGRRRIEDRPPPPPEEVDVPRPE